MTLQVDKNQMGLSHRVRELDGVTVDLLSQTIILHWMAGKNSGLDRAFLTVYNPT